LSNLTSSVLPVDPEGPVERSTSSQATKAQMLVNTAMASA